MLIYSYHSKKLIKNTVKFCQNNKKTCTQVQAGVPDRNRTCGLTLRRRPLYPTELRRLVKVISILLFSKAKIKF